jgi:hypothetical protein
VAKVEDCLPSGDEACEFRIVFYLFSTNAIGPYTLQGMSNALTLQYLSVAFTQVAPNNRTTKFQLSMSIPEINPSAINKNRRQSFPLRQYNNHHHHCDILQCQEFKIDHQDQYQQR